MKVLNAQLISRFGFISDEIKLKENQTISEIDEIATSIGNPDAECIVDARISLENAIEYAGSNLIGAIGEVIFFVNDIEGSFFYPLIDVLQIESSVIQQTVLAEARRYNLVAEITQFIQRLEDDYFINELLYELAIRNIEREWALINERMNDVRRNFFPQLNSVRDYFFFTADRIKDSLSFCEA